jgi:NAD(P)H-dependent flavin oxidoreductase YrpB (nitropropane dioxygenase family)
MWIDTPVTRFLKIRYPIVQGPFGGGSSSVELAAIVSNLGGLGSFGAQHLAPDRIKDLVADLRERTAAPFAVNLWVDNADAAMADFDGRGADRGGTAGLQFRVRHSVARHPESLPRTRHRDHRQCHDR